MKSKIKINDQLDLFLTYNNLDYKVINKMKTELDYKTINNPPKVVKSNVAIASAITAYARIYMSNFKNNKTPTVCPTQKLLCLFFLYAARQRRHRSLI